MSDKSRPEDGDRMESFFDKLMSENDAAEFLADRSDDESFMSQWKLQKQVDASLKDMFNFDSPSAAELVQTISEERDLVTAGKPTTGRMFRLVRIALAASLLGIAAWGGWQLLNDDSKVVFQPVSLAKLYGDTVDSGFKPYYECHDMQRFADTFEHRQGVALTLNEMPDDRRMLGLSYLGGVSREATAMLCEVQQQPVLVFIDKTTNDRTELTDSLDPGIKVFRIEKFGLVFYEVTPFNDAQMVDYVELAPSSIPDQSQ